MPRAFINLEIYKCSILLYICIEKKHPMRMLFFIQKDCEKQIEKGTTRVAVYRLNAVFIKLMKKSLKIPIFNTSLKKLEKKALAVEIARSDFIEDVDGLRSIGL